MYDTWSYKYQFNRNELEASVALLTDVNRFLELTSPLFLLFGCLLWITSKLLSLPCIYKKLLYNDVRDLASLYFQNLVVCRKFYISPIFSPSQNILPEIPSHDPIKNHKANK
jgi:hypothetical protein